MKLFIDTANSEKIIIGWDGERFERNTREKKSQALLTFIDEKLKKDKKTIDDVSEIEVNVGPGSFTGLRVGLAVANTIGWVRGIPINGKNIKKDGPLTPRYE